MKKTILSLLSCAVLLLPSVSLAEEGFVDLTKPNVEENIDKNTSYSLYEMYDDLDLDSDTDMFLELGYKELNWLPFYKKDVAKFYDEVVYPDYVRRTGKELKEKGMIELAQAEITTNGYYDIVTISRQPGDCDQSGCLFQIWQLNGAAWVKKFEFKALNFLVGNNPNSVQTEVIGVGVDDVPSIVYLWDGEKFRIK